MRTTLDTRTDTDEGRSIPGARRPRASLAVLALIVVLIGVAGGAYFLGAAGGTVGPVGDGQLHPVAVTPYGTGSRAFTLDLSTGEAERLPDTFPYYGNDFAISSDGTEVAFLGSGPGVSIESLDGSSLRQFEVLDAGGQVLENLSGLRMSPDGTKLVVTSAPAYETRELYVIDAATEEATKIASFRVDPYHNDLSPTFTADGGQIAFNLDVRDGGGPDLWTVPVTGGTPVLLRENAALASFSPDGSRFAYLSQTSKRNGLDRIYVGGSDLSGPVQSVAWGDGLGPTRWSPDGSRIAYVAHGLVHVRDLASDSFSIVAEGGTVSWIDDGTLFVAG